MLQSHALQSARPQALLPLQKVVYRASGYSNTSLVTWTGSGFVHALLAIDDQVVITNYGPPAANHWENVLVWSSFCMLWPLK